jgi:hypothetical protein
MKKMKKYNDFDIEQCLFYNKPPEVIIYPFWRSCNEDIKNIYFLVELNSKILGPMQETEYKQLSKLIKKINNNPIKEKILFDFLSNSSTPLNNAIYFEVFKEFSRWKSYFYNNIADYTKSIVSKFQWELIKSVGINSVMNLPLSMEQQLWIAYASAYYRIEERNFIIEIVNSLHPWLNYELYQHVKKSEENKKFNVKYEEHKKRMYSGTFGLSENDEKIIKKLEQQVNNYNYDDDLDIIK